MVKNPFFLPGTQASRSNSENASHTAQLNPRAINHFHFSNSELAVRRIRISGLRLPDLFAASVSACASSLEALPPNFPNLIDTPRRIEKAVSYRKQTSGHPSNRHTSPRADHRQLFALGPEFALQPASRFGNLANVDRTSP
jgi:hypothetical protein